MHMVLYAYGTLCIWYFMHMVLYAAATYMLEAEALDQIYKAP